MSEKPKFEWSAVKPGGEENNQEYLASIVKELNEINRKTGQPEVRLMSAEEARTGVREEELANEREVELANEREVELTSEREQDLAREEELESNNERDMEKTRGLDVRRIMAEEATKQSEAAKQAEVTKARETVPETKLVSKVSEFDPEMQEFTLEREPRKEIDVIGQGTEPVDKELAKRVEEIMALKKELEEVEQEISEIKASEKPEEPVKPEEAPEPLVAMNVDWSKSEERLAKNLAEKQLKKELSEAGLIQKIWKGKLFRQAYIDIYTEEFLDGERTDKNGKTIAEAIEEQKQALIDDFTRDAVEEMREIDHRDWDKEGFRGKNGEKLTPVDKETNAKIKSTIEDYAKFMLDISEIRPDVANDPDFIEEVDRKFNRYMEEMVEDDANNYLDIAKTVTMRYINIAKNVKDKAEQEAAMAQVMAGFQAYDVRSERAFTVAKKANVTKILDFISENKISVMDASDFSEAIDDLTMDDGERALVDGIKSSEELIGGEEGIKIMLDKSPISAESQKRWNEWWDGLSDEGRDYVKELIKQVNAYPERYNLKWGNGFRTWLTIKNARDILAA